MPQSLAKLDAAEGAFFQRELESVLQRVWEQKRPPLTAFDFIPITSEADPGDVSIVWYRMDHTGQAKIIAAGATDVPMIDVHLSENFGRIRQVGDGFRYTTDEIRAAMKAGRPLSSLKASAAMREARFKANRIAWFGDALAQLSGVFTEPNMNRATPAAAAASPNGTGWNAVSGKTAEEITADVGLLVGTSISTTRGVERVDTILIPPDEFQYLSVTRASATAPSDTTIMEFLRKVHPEITFDQASELADVPIADLPVSAAAAANVAFAYRRSDEVLRFEIPLNFTQHPPQPKMLGFVVPCEMKVAGVIVHLPLACTTMQGI